MKQLIKCGHVDPTITMIDTILQFSDLQELCRPGEKPRLSTVERWAASQGIRYRYDGKGGIWTTVDALNAALGLVPPDENAPYRPEDVI
jgi:hypothetical protein